jgi:hypothetical protein
LETGCHIKFSKLADPENHFNSDVQTLKSVSHVHVRVSLKLAFRAFYAQAYSIVHPVTIFIPELYECEDYW